MEACVADTEKYCKEHQKEYGLPDSFEKMFTEADYNCIQWITLAKYLVKYDIAARLDWRRLRNSRFLMNCSPVFLCTHIFLTARKRFCEKGDNSYKYFLLDKERRKEWEN